MEMSLPGIVATVDIPEKQGDVRSYELFRHMVLENIEDYNKYAKR